MFAHTTKTPIVTLTESTEEDGKAEEHITYTSKTFLLKDFAMIPGKISKYHRGDAEGQMWAAYEWGLSPEQYDLLDDVPMTELDAMLQAWRASSGVGLGE